MAGSGSLENCCFCHDPASGGRQPRDKSGLHALWTQNHASSAITQTERRLLAHLTFKSQAHVSAQQIYIISRKPEGKGVLGDVSFSIPISALGRQVKKPIHSVGSLPLRVPRWITVKENGAVLVIWAKGPHWWVWDMLRISSWQMSWKSEQTLRGRRTSGLASEEGNSTSVHLGVSSEIWTLNCVPLLSFCVLGFSSQFLLSSSSFFLSSQTALQKEKQKKITLFKIAEAIVRKEWVLPEGNSLP